LSQNVELGFVRHDGHRAALREALAEEDRDPGVIGVLLCGSVARIEQSDRGRTIEMSAGKQKSS
jgi:hypothetical protein